MQLLNLEEDSPNHFSSNTFACEKVAFHFAVVTMFGVVLSGQLFQCLTSWRLRWL